MPPSPAQTGAQAETPIDRKRKRQSKPTPSQSTTLNKAASASGKQRTLQGLLSSQQHKQIVDDDIPDNKRVRQEQTVAGSTPQRPSSPKPASTAMYSFPSKYENKKNAVVDLTKSPRARRPSSAAAANNLHKNNFNPNAGAKKLIVKNLRPQSSWDANKYFDETWQQLDSALTTIFSAAPVDFSMEDMYRGVENLCRQGRARDVYQKLAERCRSHINDTVKRSLLSKNRHGNVEVLQDVLAAWSSWNSQIVC